MNDYNFYYYKIGTKYYLECLESGSYFQLNENSFDILRFKKQDAINSLLKADLIGVDEDDDTLNITCVLNSKCNLKCDYCFEKDSYLNNQEEKDNLILNYLESKLRLNNNITLTGGEPLLSFELIKNICLLADKVGLNNKYTLVTNGLLLNKEMINFFDKYSFKIQISLDGVLANDNEKNDRTNITIEDQILEKVNYILKSTNNIQLTLRINFGKESIRYIEQKIERIKAKMANVTLDKLLLDFELIDAFENSYDFTSFNEKISFYKKVFNLQIKNHFKLPRQIVFGGDCMARDYNSILIDSNGFAYPCFSFVGNIDFKFKPLDTQKQPLLEKCNKKCHIKALCSGGCLYSNYCEKKQIVNLCHKIEIDEINKPEVKN